MATRSALKEAFNAARSKAGEQSTCPSPIGWGSVAGDHQEDVTCLPTSRIWATIAYLSCPLSLKCIFWAMFCSGNSCQEGSSRRTELLRLSGWAIWLNNIKYKVYDSGGPVGRATLLPVLETNQVYVGLDNNFVWLVNTLFLGEKNVYYLKSNELFGQSSRFPCFLTCHLPIWPLSLVSSCPLVSNPNSQHPTPHPHWKLLKFGAKRILLLLISRRTDTG